MHVLARPSEGKQPRSPKTTQPPPEDPFPSELAAPLTNEAGSSEQGGLVGLK